MRALLIEDSRHILTLIKIVLMRPDIEFIEAPSMQQAREHEDVDVVVIGAKHPVKPTTDLIREFASRSPAPAIVALTTDHRSGSTQKILDAGADRVVAMPFKADELRKAACSSTREKNDG